MSHRVAIVLCFVFAVAPAGSAADKLVVHEWGTFTSFQNELGEGLARINTDDEPVPPFVHQLADINLVAVFPPTDLRGFSQGSINNFTQGAPTADPRVAMRLETPVLYFHLPRETKSMTLNVSVDFRRGFLTQYFPLAEATVNGQPVKKYQFPEGGVSYSTLRWTGVRVGEAGTMPETNDHVWLAPRQVDAAPVKVGNESERFLFYRGVGEMEAPLKVIRHADQILDIRINRTALEDLDSVSAPQQQDPTSNRKPKTNSLTVHRQWAAAISQQLWLLDVRPNGTSAFRRSGKVPAQMNESDRLLMMSGKFAEADFSNSNLATLRAEMKEALVNDGLFDDEADALLNTWELSYFLSPGQRLLFLLPHSWTDAILPLTLSVPCKVNRVMVGRIELVTPRQRELIQKICDAPIPDLTDVLVKMHELQRDPTRRDVYNALASGRGDSAVLGVPVPPAYQAFLDLGRFRTSLILDAVNRADLSEARHMDRIRYLNFELLHPGQLKPE